MNQYGPRIATVSPKTLEKRRDVMEAMRALAAQEDRQVRQHQADVAALRRDLEVLRDALPSLVTQSIDQVRRECGLLLRSHLQKYSPDQPRVPAGNPGGGEWTNEGGAQVAANSDRPGYPVDLLEEEQHGGHTIERHVAKSQEYLRSRLNEDIQRIRALGDAAQGLTSQGSFPSLEAANKLVNATIAKNMSSVSLVVQGILSGVQFDEYFPAPTGYEAYAATERSQPTIRATYGVHVVIVRDVDSARGYRVFTAFPINR